MRLFRLTTLILLSFSGLTLLSCRAETITKPTPAAKKMTTPLFEEIFGYKIRKIEETASFELVLESESLAKGSLDECNSKRLELLIEKFGEGNMNLDFPTLGGKQVWADRFIHGNWRIQKNLLTDHCRLLNPKDIRKGWGSFAECRVLLEQERVKKGIEIQGDHLVFLLHGLGRSKDSLSKMRDALEKAGYQAEYVNYPSTQKKIEDHAEQIHAILNQQRGYKKVSFVTHSLGGIVLRKVLSETQPWQQRMPVHRIVMLAPPNQGSVAADLLKEWFVFEAFAGESGLELTTENLKEFPIPKYEFGIIAGGSKDGKGMNPLLPGDDDGIVAVENTKLKGMKDFLLLQSSHTFIMSKAETIEATKKFLKEGKFK